MSYEDYSLNSPRQLRSQSRDIGRDRKTAPPTLCSEDRLRFLNACQHSGKCSGGAMKDKRIRVRRTDGWGCNSCAWAHPYPQPTSGEIEPRENMLAEFHLHRCQRNPMRKKKTCEDMNQPAARILMEATARH